MDSKKDDKREQDSLAPLQLDRRAIEEEVASMKRGKGARLLTAALVVSALAVGGAWMMRQLDQSHAEGQAAAAVVGLRDQHVQAYLRCALPEAPAAVFSDSERLHSALEGLVEHHQKAYARTLESCQPSLAGLMPALAEARVGRELQPAVEGLRAAAISVEESASDLQAYLADPKRAYDYVEVTAFIDRLARAAVAYYDQDRVLRTQLTR